MGTVGSPEKRLFRIAEVQNVAGPVQVVESDARHDYDRPTDGPEGGSGDCCSDRLRPYRERGDKEDRGEQYEIGPGGRGQSGQQSGGKGERDLVALSSPRQCKQGGDY